MSNPHLDPDAIHWQPFGDFPHFSFAIQHIDRQQRIADVLFRFAAGEQIVLHRHLALNHTFVVAGEHCVYEPDGSLRERRPTGCYTVTPPSMSPHREGGGADDAIVLFSMRPKGDELLYQILDDAGQVVADVSFEMLEAIEDAQRAA